MTKLLITSLVGIVVSTSTFAQSYILLDTYASSVEEPYPLIAFGPSGIPVPSGIGYTVGFYYSTTAATFEPGTTITGDNIGIPGAPFVLATGTGSTTQFEPGAPGLFTSIPSFAFPGTVPTAWIVVVVYTGPSYEIALSRAHSSVFTISPTAIGPGPGMGAAMEGFYVAVPEPSTFALTGFGLASLLVFRRRK
jgi:hypothetical protein